MAGFDTFAGVPEPIHNSYSTPLLWHLVSAILAFCAAAEWESAFRDSARLILFSGMFFWLAALTAAYVFRSALPRLRLALALAGTFLLAAFYFYAREEANPYPDLAPREAVVTARIIEASRGINNSLYGVAEILEAPKFAEKSAGMRMWYVVSDGKKASDGHRADFIPSQIVRFSGVFGGLSLDSFKSRGYYADSPKSASFERYLSGRRIFFKMRSRVDGALALTAPSTAARFFSSARAYMERSLSENFSFFPPDSEASRTYSAMILGDKSLLTPEQKKAFSDTGTMHIFAISGLHVGFAAALLLGISSLCGINWRWSPVFCLPPLFLYVCACGARPSAMRAFGMVAVVWLVLSFGRRVKVFDALVLAAAVSLAVSPVQIFDSGWTLSYAVVASILLYGAPLYSLLWERRMRKGLPFRKDSFVGKVNSAIFASLAGGFCISLGAMFAASPLSSHGFGYISPLSVFYSPVFVLGAGIAVSLGFIGFALPAFIADFTNAAACAVVGGMSYIAREGVGIFKPAVDVRIESGTLTLFAEGSFLFLSGALQNVKPAVLRFVIAPMPLALILYRVWITK